MKENKEILLTFYPRDKCPIPIAFSITFTMNFPEDMSFKEQWKEWEEAVEILKHPLTLGEQGNEFLGQ